MTPPRGPGGRDKGGVSTSNRYLFAKKEENDEQKDVEEEEKERGSEKEEQD